MFLCSFLGWMLFFGEEVLKLVNVFFGGEKVCVMFLKLMFFKVNVLVLDDLMNYLDLELIIVLNDGLMVFIGLIFFVLYDY